MLNRMKMGCLFATVAMLVLAACGSKGGTGTSSGAGGAGQGGGAACKVTAQSCVDCVNAMCTTQETDCSHDVPCNQAQNTWGPCLCSAQAASDTTSGDACTATFTGTDATAMAATSCIQQSCASECL